jgi:hypothetical protein
MLVLALVAFLGVMLPAILGLVTTGSLVTRPVLQDRRELYAATSGLDAAIQLARREPDLGAVGGPCPDQSVVAEGFRVDVACHNHPGPPDVLCASADRFVSFVAEVRAPGDPRVLARAGAEVALRFRMDGVAVIEVRQWNPDVAGPVTTTSLLPCAVGPDGTTTTTTSTTVPVAAEPGAYVMWGDPTAVRITQGNRWRAEGSITVTDHTGAPLEGAEVTVAVSYRVDDGDWTAASQIMGITTATGGVTFHSAEYPRATSNPVTEIRFEVVSVIYEGLTWNSAANQVYTSVERPS